MSFLAGLGGNLAGSMGNAVAAAPVANAVTPNWAASRLGKLIGVDPTRISSIADSVGKGMNQIAQGGGAPASYAAPELPAPTVNNHMQLLDPNILQALIRHFGGQR